jgi:MerR family transcriptional regulator, light-induced transcriptional regulator
VAHPLTRARGGVILGWVTADRLGACRDAYLAALLGRDAGAARAAVEEALAAGAAVEHVYLDVLQPALYGIGHRWAMGEVNVAEEHFATAITHRIIDELSTRRRLPPRDGRLAIVTGTPGELHALGARIVADFLEADGWEVLQLGASTPAHDLAQLVDLERPELVALSTTTAGSLPGVAEVLERLATVRPRPLVVVGGQMWTEEMRRAANELGADLVARDPRALVATLRARVPPPRD